MTAVPASDQTRKQIADLLSGDFDKSALLRNAVRLIIEEALEAEVTDVLGREYYQRGESAGYRNGNRLGRLKTAEGIVEYAVPQVTGTAEPWASEVKQALSGRTEELERLVVEMYARGLSMRDIEAAFTGADGRCVLTKSAASPVTERLWEDYLAFAGRDLAGPPILYLFLDGVVERLHLGQPREPVLAAWGIAAGHGRSKPKATRSSCCPPSMAALCPPQQDRPSRRCGAVGGRPLRRSATGAGQDGGSTRSSRSASSPQCLDGDSHRPAQHHPGPVAGIRPRSTAGTGGRADPSADLAGRPGESDSTPLADRADRTDRGNSHPRHPHRRDRATTPRAGQTTA